MGHAARGAGSENHTKPLEQPPRSTALNGPTGGRRRRSIAHLRFLLEIFASKGHTKLSTGSLNRVILITATSDADAKALQASEIQHCSSNTANKNRRGRHSNIP